jgi:hypothetical protein
MPNDDRVTISLSLTYGRMLRRVLSDPRVRGIAIDYYSLGVIEQIVSQLPPEAETKT